MPFILTSSLITFAGWMTAIGVCIGTKEDITVCIRYRIGVYGSLNVPTSDDTNPSPQDPPWVTCTHEENATKYKCFNIHVITMVNLCTAH